MDYEIACIAKENALLAVRTLHEILGQSNSWDDPKLAELKRGIGLVIGSIEVDLLSIVYKEFPELDDLKPSQGI